MRPRSLAYVYLTTPCRQDEDHSSSAVLDEITTLADLTDEASWLLFELPRAPKPRIWLALHREVMWIEEFHALDNFVRPVEMINDLAERGSFSNFRGHKTLQNCEGSLKSKIQFRWLLHAEERHWSSRLPELRPPWAGLGLAPFCTVNLSLGTWVEKWSTLEVVWVELSNEKIGCWYACYLMVELPLHYLSEIENHMAPPKILSLMVCY